MTTDNSETNLLTVPFLYRFAHRMPEVPLRPLRYDAARQISQMLIGGRWIDTPDASLQLIGATRLTEVKRETTDDE
jgi:hypothetical protein